MCRRKDGTGPATWGSSFNLPGHNFQFYPKKISSFIQITFIKFWLLFSSSYLQHPAEVKCFFIFKNSSSMHLFITLSGARLINLAYNYVLFLHTNDT